MPIENYFEYEDGSVEEVDPTLAGEIYYFADYDHGRLSRMIGIECPLHDLGVIVHVVDDEEVLETICPANAPEIFSIDTAKAWLSPEDSGVIPRRDIYGEYMEFVMKHTVPFTKSMN